MNDKQVLTGEIAQEQLDSGDPDFSGFDEIAADALEILASYRGPLRLSRITEISEAEAEVLSRHCGELYLDGLQSISDASLKSLLRHDGFLAFCFPDNDSITLRQAKALASFGGGLSMVGSPELGEDWKTGLADDKIAALEVHPSLRFDYGILQSWLLDRLGFDFEASDTDWVSAELREKLCQAADAFEYRASDDDALLASTGLLGVLDAIRKAGRQPVHVVSLRDNHATQLLFVGTLEFAKSRLDQAIGAEI